MTMPSGVAEISHVRGTYPYAASGGELIKGYIKKSALEETPLGTIEDAMQYAREHKKYVSISVDNLAGAYDGNVVTCTFTCEPKESGLLQGESVDISSSNIYGDITSAYGRIWFPHFETVYEGSATPPFIFRIKQLGSSSYVEDGESSGIIVQGSTDAMEFSAEVPGYNGVQACVIPTGGGETCIDIPRG